MKYGSPESVKFTEDVSREMAVAGWESALELAREKGPAPIMNEEFTVTKEMLRKRPEMVRDGWKPGAKIPGRVLHAKLQPLHAAHGRSRPAAGASSSPRSARASRITPRSRRPARSRCRWPTTPRNGIEPSFAHHYFRNVIREGRKTKEKIDVFSFELLAYRELVNPNARCRSANDAEKLPEYFISADDVTPRAARRHPGRRPEVGRLLDFQDRERADGFRLREIQGHLPVRA